jgi:hypothetical protein
MPHVASSPVVGEWYRVAPTQRSGLGRAKVAAVSVAARPRPNEAIAFVTPMCGPTELEHRPVFADAGIDLLACGLPNRPVSDPREDLRLEELEALPADLLRHPSEKRVEGYAPRPAELSG